MIKIEREDTFITKYKPYYLNDFYFEDTIKTMIYLLMEMEDFNILFNGNSNSGKTSLLYALIREYYGLSKTDKLPENNILFVNNLKEQGINFFRNEMKTFCQSHSTIRNKKKMIIIDDMDMINQQNQQVFCNYIDKYKDNVCFISACSNIQKIIENIQSRIHILKIQQPTITDLYNFMNKIIVNEKIILDEETKQYILLISNYSIRSLINYLEKIYIYIGTEKTQINLDTCKSLCSNISFHNLDTPNFEKYIEYIHSNRLNDAINVMYSLYDYGYSVIDILDYFYSFIKQTEIINENDKYKIIHILCKYITIFHKIHEDIIELVLFTNNINNILNGVE